jgi:hypothetical protein
VRQAGFNTQEKLAHMAGISKTMVWMTENIAKNSLEDYQSTSSARHKRKRR